VISEIFSPKNGETKWPVFTQKNCYAILWRFFRCMCALLPFAQTWSPFTNFLREPIFSEQMAVILVTKANFSKFFLAKM
jgi:hypothetical protein